MQRGGQSWRRRPSFWLMIAGTTVLFSLEPALSLVLLALGFSALALFWIALVVRLLLLDAFGLLRDDVRCPVLRRDVQIGRGGEE